MEEIAYITDVHNVSLLTREGWRFYTQEAYLLPDMETKVDDFPRIFFFLSNKKCVERKEGICNITLFVFYIFWLDFLDDCATCLILRVKVV